MYSAFVCSHLTILPDTGHVPLCLAERPLAMVTLLGLELGFALHCQADLSLLVGVMAGLVHVPAGEGARRKGYVGALRVRKELALHVPAGFS